MKLNIDDSDGQSLERLNRELDRLRDLQSIAAGGISVAARLLSLIDEKVSGEKIALRDANRSLEVVTKSAVKASELLELSRGPERAARAPERNIVLIILESPMGDDRKSVLLRDFAMKLGDGGVEVVRTAVEEVEGSDRADVLLELNP